MNVKEFSDGFDTLVSSYRRFKNFDDKEMLDSIEFNEYEKSLFLTAAQEEIVIEIYSGKNVFDDSFEKTEETRSYLSNLVKTYITTDRKEGAGLDKNSVFFELPNDLWFITYESVNLGGSLDCSDGNDIIVTPVTQDTFYRTKNNPFRGATDRRVLRIDSGNNIAEIVSRYDVYSYLVRYLSRPKPIVLEDMPEELTINGVNKVSECLLNSALHQVILDRAVKKALASKSYYSN